jgi:hypothetical protein
VGAPWVLGRHRPRSTYGIRLRAVAPSTGTKYTCFGLASTNGTQQHKTQRTLEPASSGQPDPPTRHLQMGGITLAFSCDTEPAGHELAAPAADLGEGIDCCVVRFWEAVEVLLGREDAAVSKTFLDHLNVGSTGE